MRMIAVSPKNRVPDGIVLCARAALVTQCYINQTLTLATGFGVRAFRVSWSLKTRKPYLGRRNIGVIRAPYSELHLQSRLSLSASRRVSHVCLNCDSRLARKLNSSESKTPHESAPKNAEECRDSDRRFRYWGNRPHVQPFSSIKTKRSGKYRHFQRWRSLVIHSVSSPAESKPVVAFA